MVSKPLTVKGNKEITLLIAGAFTGPNNCVVALTPATEEFRHSSPVLIISSTNKNSGSKQAKLSWASGGNVPASDDLRPDLQSIACGSGVRVD